MAGRQICAGYYRRYDGKMFYVVTMAKDADTDEEAVIWTPTVFSEKCAYYTMSKRNLLRIRLGGRCAQSKVQTANPDEDAAVSRGWI